MWQRRLGLAGIAAFVMAVAAPAPAHAMLITDAFGFSFFSVDSIDQVAHTIQVTETIDSLSAGFTLNFQGPRENLSDDRTFAWQITKIITNGTGSDWTNFDNELKVPNPTGAPGFVSSNNFDNTSFDQGNPNRVIDSNAFAGLFVDELQARDFIQFNDGTVLGGNGDTQTFPVRSNSIRTVQLVQTPNFQNPNGSPIPEPASMLLFGLGGLGAGFIRRRKLGNV